MNSIRFSKRASASFDLEALARCSPWFATSFRGWAKVGFMTNALKTR